MTIQKLKTGIWIPRDDPGLKRGTSNFSFISGVDLFSFKKLQFLHTRRVYFPVFIFLLRIFSHSGLIDNHNGILANRYQHWNQSNISIRLLKDVLIKMTPQKYIFQTKICLSVIISNNHPPSSSAIFQSPPGFIQPINRRLR